MFFGDTNLRRSLLIPLVWKHCQVSNCNLLVEVAQEFERTADDFLLTTCEGAAFFAATHEYRQSYSEVVSKLLQPNANVANAVTGYEGVFHGVAKIAVFADGAVLCSCRRHHEMGISNPLLASDTIPQAVSVSTSAGCIHWT